MRMKYSTNNIQVSLTLQLAEFLRSKGYDIRWHSTGAVEPQTAGLPSPKDVITLTPEFPVNPTYIVRLNNRSPAPEEVAVPAFALQAVGSPKRLRRLGLGQKEHERERAIRVDGFAADQHQQKELADLLYDWLEGDDVRLRVSDYDSDPSNPPSLDPVEVDFAVVDRLELIGEVEAVRHYIQVTAAIRYVE